MIKLSFLFQTGELTSYYFEQNTAAWVPRKRTVYSEHFEFSGSGKDKVGFCLHCGKDEVYGNYIKVVKMKNANTSGLLSHLRNEHKDIYNEIFGFKADKKQTGIAGQEIIPDFEVSVIYSLH